MIGTYVWKKYLTKKKDDKSVEKNVTYEYAITCVDTSGNESPRSAVVEETIRTWKP